MNQSFTMKKVLIITMGLSLIASLAYGSTQKQGERYLNQHKLSTGMVAIIAEGDLEPRSMGSYSIRIYGANSQFPADDFLSGTIRTRDGSVEKVIVQDIDRDGTEEVIVFIRNAGSGHYLSMDVFQYQFKKLKLITSVSGLEPNIDPVNELKRILKILKTAPDKD